MDDPTLLYHLLCQYMGTAEMVIKTYLLSLNNLLEKLGELEFDINKFYNYALKMIKTLHDAGGKDKEASIKLYKVLNLTKVDTFSSEIRAYEATVATKNKPLDFTKLTIIACTEYTSLIMHSQQPNSPNSSSSKKSHGQHCCSQS
eukprot:2461597-Ditylum_brightwellii.AAC.2